MSKTKTRKSPARRSRPPKAGRAKVVANRGAAAPKPRRARVVTKTGGLVISEVEELNALRRELERATRSQSPLRWNADPDDVQRSVAKLVLTLVEFIRQLLERQAIRRMEAGTLTDQQVENIGRALMQLEDTVRDIAAKFGVPADELNLDLGVGKLM
jgi:hypothetical protein